MNFDLSDEQIMLREQAQRLFAEQAAPARLRELLEEARPFDAGLWHALAELGFLGAAIAEEFGGIGMSPLDLAMIVEEAGRACAPVPLSSSICLAANALAIAGTPAQQREWLPKLADGSVIATFAHVEGPGSVLEARLSTRISNAEVTGTKFPVPDAAIAQIAVVAGKADDGTDCLAIVVLDQPGVALEPVAAIDQLRHHARIRFDGAAADVMCSGQQATAAIGSIYDVAAVLCAFEQIGGAERCLHMARDYALERKVFSRPIGSFQAIKHRLADMLALIELARSNAWFAAWALVNDPGEAPAAIAVARLSATEAYEFASRENLHVHGGIGYTWEADCHFHYRRSRLLSAALGNASEWSDLLIKRIRGSVLAAS